MGAYLKKLGEQRALDEKFDQILAQLKITTKTIEDIKTNIASEYWLAQERWKLRWDFYLGILKNLREFGLGVVDYLFTLSRLNFGDDDEYTKNTGNSEDKLDRINGEINAAVAAAHLVSPRAAEIFLAFETKSGETIAALEAIIIDASRDCGWSESNWNRVKSSGARSGDGRGVRLATNWLS